VVAGLQSDVSRAAAQPLARVLSGNLEGGNLGVVQQVVLVPTLAGHLPGAVQNHAAHGRVGRADAMPRRASSRARCIHWRSSSGRRVMGGGTLQCKRERLRARGTFLA
jgi:hypothetical protein